MAGASPAAHRTPFGACPFLEVPQRRARDDLTFLPFDAALAASITPAAES
jgi:hypothetical protein